MTQRTHLGWLGPMIVVIGAAVAGAGVWYMVHARPKPGAVIDEMTITGGNVVVRAEASGGDRSFLELHVGDAVKWQALIPHYAGSRGRSGIAWSDRTVTVRVERHGRAEVFAFAIHNAAKLGSLRLAPEHEPTATEPQGPITLTDHERSYELVGGPTWHQLIAIDLKTGDGLWKRELGPGPIASGHVDGGIIYLEQTGVTRRIAASSGHDVN